MTVGVIGPGQPSSLTRKKTDTYIMGNGALTNTASLYARRDERVGRVDGFIESLNHVISDRNQ
jgi:hypothetical protein